MSNFLDTQSLKEKAKQASSLAYAPYSGHRVGCVLKTKKGIFKGANIENSSFGLSICAERVALFSAVLNGERSFLAISVYSPDEIPFPCGACLQALSEFFNGEETVLLASEKEQRVFQFKELFPHPFKFKK